MGKLPDYAMRRYVFSRRGAERGDVAVGPAPGIDVAALAASDDLTIIVHGDPIVGAIRHAGWLAVHVASNDVATAGVRPRWTLLTVLLPAEWEEGQLDLITSQADEAARSIGVAIVGGHTGYSDGLLRPLVVATSIGIAIGGSRVITAAGARPGDVVYLTKGAAVEGSAVLAEDFAELLMSKGLDEDRLEAAASLIRRVSLVDEAVALANVASAMHDASRGGVAEALAELAYASGVMMEAWERDIPVPEEAGPVIEAMGFDPLWMLSSGTLVFTAPRSARREVEDALQGMRYAEVGVVKDGSGVLLHRVGGADELIGSPMPDRDELSRIWRELGPRMAGSR